MSGSSDEVRRRKAQLRREAVARRAELPDKDGRSLLICQKLLALPEFQAARAILFYVHYGDEVRTQPMLRWLLGEAGGGPLSSAFFGEAESFGAEQVEAGRPTANTSLSPEEAVAIGPNRQVRQLLVPYCQGDDLKLFRLRSMAELAPGSFGILEPVEHLRTVPDRQASIHEVDLVVAPGVAFDRQGGRLGHGRGYYDRLLAQARPDTILVGLAYERQIFPELPTLPTDVRMHKVITETNIYYTFNSI